MLSTALLCIIAAVHLAELSPKRKYFLIATQDKGETADAKDTANDGETAEYGETDDGLETEDNINQDDYISLPWNLKQKHSGLSPGIN